MTKLETMQQIHKTISKNGGFYTKFPVRLEDGSFDALKIINKSFSKSFEILLSRGVENSSLLSRIEELEEENKRLKKRQVNAIDFNSDINNTCTHRNKYITGFGNLRFWFCAECKTD